MQFASLLDCVKTPRCFDFFSRARYTTNSNEHIAVSSPGHEGTVSRATSVSVRARRKFPWPKVVPCTESRNWRSKFDKTWILTGRVLHQESRLAMSWILRKKTQANEQCKLSKIDYEVFRKLSFLRTHPNSYFRYSGSAKESELIQLNLHYLLSSRGNFEITESKIAKFNCVIIGRKLCKHEGHSVKCAR